MRLIFVQFFATVAQWKHFFLSAGSAFAHGAKAFITRAQSFSRGLIYMVEPALPQLNVLGTRLEICCQHPITGFYRDGFCHTSHSDWGRHTVCAVMTDAFLQFSLSRGNDLITPNPAMGFPGLKTGDHWCLCASRWAEAHQAGVAPPVYLSATNQAALEVIELSTLQQKAVD